MGLGFARVSLEWAWFSYLAKTVLIHKVPIALHAVVLVVPLGLHMLIGSFLSVKHLGTRLAGNCRLPMMLGIHMLIGSILGKEGTSARFTFKDWFPVANRIHMLVGSMLGKESTSARFTFKDRCPMIDRIHMLLTAILSPKLTITGLALHPMIVIVHVSVILLSVVELKVTGATFEYLD